MENECCLRFGSSFYVLLASRYHARLVMEREGGLAEPSKQVCCRSQIAIWHASDKKDAKSKASDENRRANSL